VNEPEDGLEWAFGAQPNFACSPRAQRIAESVIVWECGDQLQIVSRMVKDKFHECFPVGAEDL
jgi:hypothetical protein